MAQAYYNSDGIIRQIPIELTTMRGWNTLKRILNTNLAKAACLKEVARYKKCEKEMRWGEIIGRNTDGSLRVEIEIEDGNPIIATCPGNRIGLHERDRLRVGQRRAFNIRRVEPVLLNKTPRIKVVVDRVSKNLVKNLLEDQLVGVDVKIRCEKRYVGRKSFVVSNRFLPRKAILAAKQEFGEHIQVSVVNSLANRKKANSGKKTDVSIWP
ncbi:hypothetical protein [Desulfolithobacter dissulfuricans]|nr:hypothetical protein [Desulfolithobacter dissulfuricans]